LKPITPVKYCGRGPMVPSVPLLEGDHLSKTFRVRSRARTVLVDASLAVAAGTVTVLRGRSGAGKSTLIALLAGLDRPSSGSVSLDGVPYASLPRRALTALRRERIGIVFQSFLLIESLSAAENVEVALLRCGLDPRSRRERAAALLAELGVDDPALLPRELSEGLRQRVAIARALARDPPLVLADEPLTQLDAESASATATLLLDAVARRRAALVVATHGAAGAERLERAASRVCHLQDGRILDA
jgi:putative ABC transport system ATP-binding protein